MKTNLEITVRNTNVIENNPVNVPTVREIEKRKTKKL